MGYIGIVDYGAGNLMSVSNSLNFLGLENKIVTTPELMEGASGIILPGVGAFPDAMQALEESGLTASRFKRQRPSRFWVFASAHRCCLKKAMKSSDKGSGLAAGPRAEN